MKNSFDITNALNEGIHDYAILSGEKPIENLNKPFINKSLKNEKQELFHFDIKLFKTKLYSFQIIQIKQI
jgi:hypothetical protein